MNKYVRTPSYFSVSKALFKIIMGKRSTQTEEAGAAYGSAITLFVNKRSCPYLKHCPRTGEG